jgi:hypothetical protein
MVHKSVCIDCRKSLNISPVEFIERQYPCSECGRNMILLNHRFKPPKKTDDKKWKTVKYLIENGFYYQRIYDSNEIEKNVSSHKNPVAYPENIKDAKEFTEKYKKQAIK